MATDFDAKCYNYFTLIWVHWINKYPQQNCYWIQKYFWLVDFKTTACRKEVLQSHSKMADLWNLDGNLICFRYRPYVVCSFRCCVKSSSSYTLFCSSRFCIKRTQNLGMYNIRNKMIQYWYWYLENGLFKQYMLVTALPALVSMDLSNT